jgi:hypothetical protein
MSPQALNQTIIPAASSFFMDLLGGSGVLWETRALARASQPAGWFQIQPSAGFLLGSATCL